MPRCWPVALAPRRLWCTSLLPRKPGLGLTVTTMGDTVTIAASWRADTLRRATVESFVSRWMDAMDPARLGDLGAGTATPARAQPGT